MYLHIIHAIVVRLRVKEENGHTTTVPEDTVNLDLEISVVSGQFLQYSFPMVIETSKGSAIGTHYVRY